MHVALQRLEMRDVAVALGLERVEHRLVLAGGVHAPLDAELLDQPGEAEAGRNDADRADDGTRIDEDVIAGERDHVAARRGNVLDRNDDLLAILLGERADALVNEMRLHRRAARRIHHDGHRRRLLHREGTLELRRDGSERDALPQRRDLPDDARKADHRHDDLFLAEAGRQQAAEGIGQERHGWTSSDGRERSGIEAEPSP